MRQANPNRIDLDHVVTDPEDKVMIAQFKKLTLTVALGASVIAVTAPAEAQRYGGYRGRDNGSTAIVAGVAGLALGAVLASSANRRDDGITIVAMTARSSRTRRFTTAIMLAGTKGTTTTAGITDTTRITPAVTKVTIAAEAMAIGAITVGATTAVAARVTVADKWNAKYGRLFPHLCDHLAPTAALDQTNRSEARAS